MAVIIVLGLLAITLALGYSLLRSQATTLNLQDNLSRSAEARMAAEAGLAAALRAMHQSNWGGVASTLTSNVSSTAWYEVSYTTGDSTLSSSSPDYAEFPFRVTITAKGYAKDLAHPDVRAIYEAQAVVQLTRRAIQPEPSIWTTLQAVSVYQWSSHSAVVQAPVRIEGDVCILGELRLCPTYPDSSYIREDYLEGLDDMRRRGLGDFRPFSGRVYYTNQTDSGTRNLLWDELGLDTTYLGAVSSSAPLLHPGVVTTYQLYPGGKAYDVPNIQSTYGSSLANISLGPDPQSNPLGVFRSSGPLELGNNAKITGTVITAGATARISVTGTGVEVKATNLPRLYGSNQNYQLPVALVQEDFHVGSASNSTLAGLAMVWDDYVIDGGTMTTNFTHTGRLLTSDLSLQGRTEWNLGLVGWLTRHLAFKSQSTIDDFPRYLQVAASLPAKPTLTIRPDSSGVKHHWQDWSQPIYVKADGDEGLRWEVVRMTFGL